MPYTTRHGFGYTIFELHRGGVSSDMHTYVAIDAPVKFIVLKLHNNSGKSRRLSVTGFFELVLGTQRAANIPHIVTEVDPKTGAFLPATRTTTSSATASPSSTPVNAANHQR